MPKQDGASRSRRLGVLLGFGLLGLLAAFGASCDDDVAAAELGERLFASPQLSTSRFNKFSCATCHAKQADAPLVIQGRWDSGYNLHGVSARSGWWGGASVRLIDAINVCVEQFMGGRPLLTDDSTARQLGAYLAQGAPAETLPIAPLSVVRVTGGLEDVVGDAGKGAVIYASGCQRCHGAVGTGDGRLDPSISLVPGDTIRVFPNNARAAFVEKVRHGRFYNIGGVMPFYTLEVMSDLDLADLLAFVGL